MATIVPVVKGLSQDGSDDDVADRHDADNA